jgi:TP901 family phage tail tape measure protein
MGRLYDAYIQVGPKFTGMGDIRKQGDAAGKQYGEALAKAAEKAAAANVRRLGETLAKARSAEADAAGKVRVAEAKLNEVRADSRAKASQIAAAEENLAKAQRKSASATDTAKTAAESLDKARDKVSKSAGDVGTKTGNRFSDAFKKVTASRADSDGKVVGTRFGVGFHGAFGGIISRSSGLFAGLGLGLVAKDAVNLEATFSQTMNTMAAVAGVPAAQIKELSALALKMGADTTFSAAEAGDAMLELAKGGMSAAAIKAGGLSGTLQLAAAGGTDLATAATIASNAMGAFSLKGSDMASVAAALAGGANASSASVESLGQALSQVGPGAKLAGLSLQDTVGVLSAFDSEGIKGSDAGTSLKTMLTRLVPSTKAASTTMKELGLKFTDAQGRFLPITNIAEQLRTKLGKLSAEQKTTALATIFGSDATRAASVLMDQGAAGIGRFIKATQDQGAAQKVAAARMSGTAGALESFKGSVETAKLQLGQFLAPAIQKGLQELTKGVNGLVPATKSFAGFLGDSVVPRMRDFVGFVVRAKDFLIPFVATLGAAYGAFKALAIIRSVVAGVMALNAALIANPIGLVVVALAALVGGLVYAYKHSETFRAIVDAAFRAIVVSGKFMWDNYLRPMFAAFGAVLQAVWGKVQLFAKIVGISFGAIKEPARIAIKYVIDAFLNMVGVVLTGAAKAFGWVPGLGDKLKGASQAFNRFRDSVNRTLDGIHDQSVNVAITLQDRINAKQVNRAVANNLDRRGIKVYARGGDVSGGIPGVDSVPALLMPDEHVLTREDVKAMGGQEAVYQFRGQLHKFANGGAVDFDVHAGINNRGAAASAAAGANAYVARTASAIGSAVRAALAPFAAGAAPSGPPGSRQSFRGVTLNTRTIQMLLNAEKILGHMFHIMQGSYSTRVSASGSTHAGGGAMDTDGPGGWDRAVSALRKAGFAAWHRTPSQGPWGHHIHSIAIGDSSASPAAKRQVQSFLRGGDGLGHGMKFGGAVLPVKKYDTGGNWPPGTFGYNGTGKTETVRTAEQEASLGKYVNVSVYIDGQEFRGMVRHEVSETNRADAISYNL